MDWKEEFRQHIFILNDVDTGDKILHNNAPRFIYKYCSGKKNSEGQFLDVDNLYNNEVWASSAAKFNDPYDCMLVLNGISKEYEEELRNLSEVYSNRCYVSCFSEEGLSLPMWSYYADNHKGFCVQYQTELLEEPVFPVFYRNEAENLLDVIGHENKIMELSLIKSHEWSHENEWRMVSIEEPTCNDKLGKILGADKPAAIYMGCRMSSELEVEIVTYSKCNNVKLYKMELSISTYTLKPINVY